MPNLGLGVQATKSGVVLASHVTDNLKMLHRYNTGSVVPVSDGAAAFDGSSDHIQLGSAISHNTISISSWIYVVNDATSKTILDTRDADNDGIYFWIDSSENLFLYINSSDSGGSDASITPNAWTHVAGTYDGTNMKLYVNGALMITQADAGSSETVSTTTAPRIGKSAYTNANWFNGYMSNVGVWSGVLTQAQIKSIMWKNYAGLTDSEKTNLVSWWNLSADANDSHGSNNGTLS